MTKETLIKAREVWEERKKKGDKQADAKIAKIDLTLEKMESSNKPNVLETLKAEKAKK